MKKSKIKNKKSLNHKFSVETFVRPGLAADEVQEIKDAFDIFDTDGVGLVKVSDVL